MRIDAHQHFWFYKEERDAWIDDSMSVLKQNFLPEDLHPLLDSTGMDGCVAVQANQSEKETHFLLNLTREFDWIKGVVGWVDLRAEDLEQRLHHFDQFPRLSGFRHVLEEDPDPELIVNPKFQKGLKKLNEHGYTYDILIYAHQLEPTVQAIQDLPEMPLVIDHIAKPEIEDGNMEDWERWMRKMESREHVHCKVSGMVTEADWETWSPSDLTPYLDVVFDIFGPERMMIGSDWPVCTLAASYDEVIQIVDEYMDSFSDYEREQVFGETAQQFYGLD